MSIVFSNSQPNIGAFLVNLKDGTYVMNTKIQREYTKSYKWKSDLIFYIMLVGEIPGKIYFHPVANSSGITMQESLDGKSRVCATEEFYNGVFRLGSKFDVGGFEHMYGKFYSELVDADQRRFRTSKVSVVEALETLTDKVATVFFSLIKTPSNCKTGEGLHSNIESPNRKMLDHKLTTDTEFVAMISGIWGKDPKFPHYTVLANCMMYREFGLKKTMSSQELCTYWDTGVSQTVFDEVVKNMKKVWDLKKGQRITIKNLNSASVFCPFFMIFSDKLSDTRIASIVVNWPKTQFGRKVDGNHNIVAIRYKILLRFADGEDP